MNADRLLAHFNRISDAPDAIPRLRQFILDLAVRGKLVEQDPNDEPAAELLERIHAERKRLLKDGLAKKGNAFAHIEAIEMPYAIPERWEWVRLGECLNLINGRAFKPTDWLTKGLPIIRIQNLNSENAPFNYCDEATVEKRHVVESGSFLISWSGTPGTSFGAFIWKRERAALNQHIFRCIQNGGAYFDRFLRIAINGRLDEMIAKAHGGVGLQHITKGKLEHLPLSLPPLAEQQRIVAKVDELMGLCDWLETAQRERESRRDRLTAASLARLSAVPPAATADAEADGAPPTLKSAAAFVLNHLPRLTTRPEHIQQLRQTIFNLAVRGQLVPQDPKDEPVAELLTRIYAEQARLVKEGRIPKRAPRVSPGAAHSSMFPNQWQVVNFGDLCNIVTSGSRGWAEFYSDTGPKFIRAQNIRFGRLKLDDLACVSPPKTTERARAQASNGDLFVVITGAGVTNPALLDHDLGEAYVSQHVALIKPTEPQLSRWLLLSLMAPAGCRAELVERAYGAGKPGINLDNIRSLKVPLPPLAEQYRIVAKVDGLMALCDRLEAQLTATHAGSSRLLEAVLHKALVPAVHEAARAI